MTRKIFISITGLCILLCAAFSAASTGQKSTSNAQFVGRINSLVRRAEGTWAIEVVSLKSGETLYERNAHKQMIPASNMKLFTTAAALSYLGPDFTTKTSVYFNGSLDKNGVLHGDLIIYGRGDPNISGRFTNGPTVIFESMAESLKSCGLREVEGDVVGDDSYFDADYYGPWDPAESNKWYAARVSALTFNDNCLDICVTPGEAPGKKPVVVQSPESSYLRVVNKATTTNKKNNSVWVSPLRGGKSVAVSGKIWSRKDVQELWFPVASPALYTATVFKETIEKAGIAVKGTARTIGKGHKSEVPKGASPIVEYESLPLSEMIKVVNKRSQNLHAELLLKQIGLHKGDGPTFDGGTDAVREFTQRAGIDPDEIVIVDASGLSRTNRATAHSIVQLLAFMHASQWKDVFRDSLAVAGVDNSLKKMTWVVPEGRVLAKTGSLKNVVALSGYADGNSEQLAFSIIVNNFGGNSQQTRDIRDRICAELVRYDRPKP